MQGSRQAILDRIRSAAGPAPEGRRATVEARLSSPSPALVPERAKAGPELHETFRQRVEGTAATYQEVASWSDVAAAVAEFVKQKNLPTSMAVAPDPRLDSLDNHGLLTVHRGPALPKDLVAVTVADLGMAEIGALVLTSGAQTPTSLNFLPDMQIVCLSRKDVVGGYESVWTALREREAMPRTVNLIAGPSRTGDIEQTIQMGAHGPRNVHVIVVDE
jgi:L-lactate dehydrogenase complex protein LldG